MIRAGHLDGRQYEGDDDISAPDGGLPTDARGFGSMIWRRAWVIVPILLIVPLTAYILTSTKPAVYEASSQVLLNQQVQALSGLDNALVLQPDRVVRTQADVARLPVIAERVIRTSKSDMDVNSFLRQSSIDADATVDMLTFRVRDSDEAVAVRLANLYALEYVGYRRELDTATLTKAAQIITKQIATLKREGLSVSSTLYGELVKRQQELQAATTLQQSNATIVRVANDATQVEPRPKKVALIALALGILLALSVALVMEAFDTRVRRPEQLADGLNMPLLGSLSAPPRRLRDASRLVMLEEPNSPGAEALRILRSTIEAMLAGSDTRSILVTSGLDGDGKSTTAANLAVSFARAGKHVVLVDFDLRHPGLSQFFSLHGKPGVTDVLLRRHSLDQVLVGIPLDVAGTPRDVSALSSRGSANQRDVPVVGRLEVIGRGSPAQNAPDFMIASSLADLLGKLESRSDLVIVDGAPLLLASDGLVLGSVVDSVLFVARENRLVSSQMRELRRMLSRVSASKLGLVATGHPASKLIGYYGMEEDTSLSAPRVRAG